MGKRFLTGLIVLQMMVIVIGTVTGVQALADLKQNYTVPSTGLVLQPRIIASAQNSVQESDLLQAQTVIEQRLDFP